jgi:hypothetical protein
LTPSLTAPTLSLLRPDLPIVYAAGIRSEDGLDRSVTWLLTGDSFDLSVTNPDEETNVLESCVERDLSASPAIERQLHNLWNARSLIFTMKTVTLTFARSLSFQMATEEEVVQLRFTSRCFMRHVEPDTSRVYLVVRRGSAPVTLAPNATAAPDPAAAAEEREIARIVKAANDGAVAAALGAYFVSSAAVAPSVAMHASRSRAAVSIAQCNNGVETGVLPLSESLFPVTVGDGPLRYYLGALVLNSVLMFTFALIHAAVVFGLMMSRLTHSHDGSGFLVPSIAPLLAKARCPSLLFPAYCSLTAAAMKHGFLVVGASRVASEQVGATIVALPWFLVLPAVGYITLSRRFTARFHPYTVAPSIFGRVFLGAGLWRNPDDDYEQTFTGRFSSFFSRFIGDRQAFGSEELFLAMLLGTCEGIAVGSGLWSVCVVAGVVSAIALVVHLVLILRFVPFQRRVANGFEVFLTLAQIISMATATVRVGVAGGDGKLSPATLNAVVAFVVVAESVVFIYSLVTLAIAVYELWQMHYQPRLLAPRAETEGDGKNGGADPLWASDDEELGALQESKIRATGRPDPPWAVTLETPYATYTEDVDSSSPRNPLPAAAAAAVGGRWARRRSRRRRGCACGAGP